MTDVYGTAALMDMSAALARGKKSEAELAKERRERIATAVLAGLNAHGGYFGPDAETLARRAVKMADALIVELDK